MGQINIQMLNTHIGELVLGSYDEQLCLLDFRYRKMRKRVDNRIKTKLSSKFVEQSDDVLVEAVRQVQDYLSNQRTDFDLPILTVGTDFQLSVWKALMDIPYGETLSYRDLAKSIGNEKAVRAVGNANGANVLALIIPCHRVIGSQGETGGYAGGVVAKKHLLALEKGNAGVSTEISLV